MKEARDRVSTALSNSGFKFPVGRATICLASADVKKESPSLDSWKGRASSFRLDPRAAFCSNHLSTKRSMNAPIRLAQFRTGTAKTSASLLIGLAIIDEIMYHPADVGTCRGQDQRAISAPLAHPNGACLADRSVSGRRPRQALTLERELKHDHFARRCSSGGEPTI